MFPDCDCTLSLGPEAGLNRKKQTSCHHYKCIYMCLLQLRVNKSLEMDATAANDLKKGKTTHFQKGCIITTYSIILF